MLHTPLTCQCRNEPQRQKTYRLTCAPKKDSDQPAHPRSLIKVFVVRMKKLCIPGYPKCVQGRFWSGCANVQADQNLRWAHMSEGTFWSVTAQMKKYHERKAVMQSVKYCFVKLLRRINTHSRKANVEIVLPPPRPPPLPPHYSHPRPACRNCFAPPPAPYPTPTPASFGYGLYYKIKDFVLGVNSFFFRVAYFVKGFGGQESNTGSHKSCLPF